MENFVKIRESSYFLAQNAKIWGYGIEILKKQMKNLDGNQPSQNRVHAEFR